MFSKTLLIVVIVNLISDYTYGQKDKKFFRADYTFLEEANNFYKIHTIHRTWADARKVCAQEGSSLFYPENDDEAVAVLSLWNATRPFQSVYVAISDLVAKGVFETTDGHPLSTVYNYWSPGEPNDEAGDEDCVTMRKDGTLSDISCYHKYPFICKKKLEDLEWNTECNMPNKDYTFNKDLGKCYKMHTTPLSWTEGYAMCRVELSTLAVITTKLEADYLAKLTESTPKPRVKGKYQKGIYHVGFHNRFNEGWQTVRGTPIKLQADAFWDNYQPDEEDREECGSMFFNGRLSNIDCDTKSFFICEHDIKS